MSGRAVNGVRVLVVEHQASCPPALIGGWLTDVGCVLEVCRPYLGEALPSLPSYDAVLVLGGDMGADDDQAHPWLAFSPDGEVQVARFGPRAWGIQAHWRPMVASFAEVAGR